MSKNKVRDEILSQATEDYTAFWEIEGRLRPTYPAADAQKLHDTIVAELQQLIEEGLIYLCEFDYREGTCQPLSGQIKEALVDSVNWQVPNAELQVRFVATDAGMDSYFGGREGWQPRPKGTPS